MRCRRSKSSSRLYSAALRTENSLSYGRSKQEKRHPTKLFLSSGLLAVPPRRRVRTSHARDLVALKNERHIEQPDQTVFTREPMPHQESSTTPHTNIRIMTHATTTNHRFTPAFQEHSDDPKRIYRPTTSSALVRNNPIQHLCSQIQRIWKRHISRRRCNTLTLLH